MSLFQQALTQLQNALAQQAVAEIWQAVQNLEQALPFIRAEDGAALSGLQVELSFYHRHHARRQMRRASASGFLYAPDPFARA